MQIRRGEWKAIPIAIFRRIKIPSFFSLGDLSCAVFRFHILFLIVFGVLTKANFTVLCPNIHGEVEQVNESR